MRPERKWYLVTASPEWKAQVAPEELLAAVREDVERRGTSAPVEAAPCASAGLDRRGAIKQDRPVERFRLLGLDLSVPSEHVASFADQLESLAPRRAGRRAYYKLHGGWTCLALTPAQRRQLLRSLRARSDAAEARAAAFYQENLTPAEVLVEVARRVTGEAPPAGALGPDRHRRFRSRARA